MGNQCTTITDGNSLANAIEEDDFATMEVLKSVPWISSLQKPEQLTLSRQLKTRDFKEGEYMMRYGEIGTDFFIIVRGTCSVLSSDGTEVAKLSAGDFVGEMALIERKPRNATVLCIEDCQTLVANKELFDSVLGNNKNVRFAKRTAKRNAVLTTFKMDDLDEKEEKYSDIDVEKTPKQVEWLQDCVKYNLMFAHLEPQSRLDAINKMYQEKVAANFDLIKQHDTNAATFYVIEQGSFAIIVDGVKVCTYTKGMCFGELALMHNAPRAATVRSLEPSVVWVMQRKKFRLAVARATRKMRSKRIEWLTKVPVFQSITKNQLDNVDVALETRMYSKDQIVFKEGDQGDRFYIVKSGQIRWMTSDGESGTRDPGEYFGERALLKNNPRAATITATKQTECLELIKKDFEDLLPMKVTQEMDAKIEEEIASTEKFHTSKKQPSPLLKNLCRLDQLKTIGVLGKGAFGVVTLVVDRTTNKSYALKAIKKCEIVDLGQQEHIINEKDVMLKMNNEFLVNLRGTFKDALRVYFLLDVCLGGELFTILRNRRYFDEATSRFYAACVVEAFAYMHSLSIVYRDLKPENLVLDSRGFLKIADFGFAKEISGKTHTLCGTPDYLAPEIVTGRGHGFGVDWWTLGILIYEMLASFPPFFDDQPIETYRKIVKGKVRFPQFFSSVSKDIVKAFLKVKAMRRLGVLHDGNVQMVRGHPWFKRFNWSGLQRFKALPPIVPTVSSPADISNFTKMKEEKDDARPVRPADDFDETF